MVNCERSEKATEADPLASRSDPLQARPGHHDSDITNIIPVLTAVTLSSHTPLRLTSVIEIHLLIHRTRTILNQGTSRTDLHRTRR